MRMRPSFRSETAPSMQVGLLSTSSTLSILPLACTPGPPPFLTGGLLTPRGREQQAAKQQHLHSRQEERGGSGHALPVPKADQRHLGAGGATHSAREPQLHGEGPYSCPTSPGASTSLPKRVGSSLMGDTLAQVGWGPFEPSASKHISILSLERTLENFQLNPIKSSR